ncbi:MAG: cation:proton antiporter [Candidatus ainarchaeum sp.]|nr:cation:proton antiporter [Candidatus ainarchaeum sp.]
MFGTETILLIIALVIFSGFIGMLVFKKTKLSDVLLLMILGLLIGPVFQLIDFQTIALIRELAPFLAALVLIMLLFESGLKMNFFKVIHELRFAFVFIILVFLASITVVSLTMLAVGWPLLYGLILGAIIGGTSSAIVLSLIERMNVKPETKILLNLESAFTDALCIIVTIVLIEIVLSSTIDAQQISHSIAGAFLIAIGIGAIAAIIWMKLLRDIKTIKEMEYILTIAVLFSVFFIAEFVKSNGAIAALAFGLVLGNSWAIMNFLRMKPITLDTNISLFQKEISFFIRTFFFIYIGIIFELSMVTSFVILVSIGIAIALLLARTAITKLLYKASKKDSSDNKAISIMMPRGLAAAVLASYPLSAGLQIDFATQTIQIVFLIILFSNIITSAGVIFSERKKNDKKTSEKNEALEEIKISEKIMGSET